jgi:phosphomannomutase
VRASGTESMVRVIAEAATQERARDLAEWARERLGV